MSVIVKIIKQETKGNETTFTYEIENTPFQFKLKKTENDKNEITWEKVNDKNIIKTPDSFINEFLNQNNLEVISTQLTNDVVILSFQNLKNDYYVIHGQSKQIIPQEKKQEITRYNQGTNYIYDFKKKTVIGNFILDKDAPCSAPQGRTEAFLFSIMNIEEKKEIGTITINSCNNIYNGKGYEQRIFVAIDKIPFNYEINIYNPKSSTGPSISNYGGNTILSLYKKYCGF